AVAQLELLRARVREHDLVRLLEGNLAQYTAAAATGCGAAPGRRTETCLACDVQQQLLYADHAHQAFANRNSPGCEGAGNHTHAAAEPVAPRTAAGKLTAVAPPCFLGERCLADAYELDIAYAQQRDVL